MATFILSKDTELHIAATLAGEYNLLAGGLTLDETDEATDDEEFFTFGSLAPIAEEGEDAGDVDFTCLLSADDTTGQAIAKAARRSGGTVGIRALWAGPDGPGGEQFEATVRRFNKSSDRNGTGQNKYVRGTIGFRIIAGTRTDVVPA